MITIPVSLPGVPHTCSLETRRRVLRSVRWFSDLDDDQIDQINARITSFAWETGRPLQAEGEPATALHLIAAGAAAVRRADDAGTTRIVDIAVPGDLVGVLPELGGGFYTDSVVPLRPTCALRLDGALLRTLLVEYPSVALQVIDDLAQKLARARGDQAGSASPVPVRVAKILLDLADRAGRADGAGILIDLPLGRADIAQIIGSTEESVSRAMSGLRKDEVIASGRQWTRVVDLAELRRRCRP